MNTSMRIPQSFEDEDDLEGTIDLESDDDLPPSMALQDKEEDLQDTIDLEKEEDLEGTIDLEEYSNSPEAEEASNWETAKDIGIQAGLGFAQAFTWPLDVLKVAMLGEGLSDIDELEESFAKAGKPFDKDKYIKTVMEQAEFIPTQELLEKQIEKYTGADLSPKTKPGKFFNKLFFLGGLTRGKGLGKAAKAGIAGASTTAALRELGTPEVVSEIAGDVAGGLASVGKQARKLSPEAARLQQIGDKYGLPLMEVMLRDEIPVKARISEARKSSLQKQLGMTTEEAIDRVIEDRLPISKLRNQGQNLEVVEQEAYNKAKDLAKANQNPLNKQQILTDIDAEISRIRHEAPSPSNAEEAAIRILEKEKESLSRGKTNVQQLINQTQKYNSNVKNIYRKPEFTGMEEEVKNTYGFLNNSIRNTIEKEAGSEVADAFRTANKIYGQNAALAKSEALLEKPFQNGDYSPKKLQNVLNTKQGAILQRDIGKEGIKELRDIAEFGTKAQKATTQFANSSRHKFQVSEWGPLAGFLLAKAPPVGVAAAAAKPFFDYVRGYLLTKPASRTVYKDIVKNAAQGSFKNMTGDFAKLENQIVEDFGSIQNFMKEGLDEVEFYREGEEDES